MNKLNKQILNTAWEEISIGEYISSVYNHKRITTNDENLYNRIVAANPNCAVYYDPIENNIQEVTEEFLRMRTQVEVDVEIKGSCSLLCVASQMLNFIKQGPSFFYFTNNQLLKDTVEAMQETEEKDQILKDVSFAAVNCLFSPNYQNCNFYIPYSDSYKNKAEIINKVSNIIPKNFQYLQPYKAKYLFDLHKQFTIACMANIEENHFSVDIDSWFDSKSFLQRTPDMLNSYEYTEIFKNYVYEICKPLRCPSLITNIKEILWVRDISGIYLHLSDQAELVKYLPYLKSMMIKNITVSFKSIQSINGCDCPKQNLLTCKVKSPNPPIEIRPQTFSISDISKLRTCPIMFYLESILGIKQFNIGQRHLIGIVIHSILEQAIHLIREDNSIVFLKKNINEGIEQYNLSKTDKAMLVSKINQIADHLWPIIVNAKNIYCEVEGAESIVKDNKTYKLHGRADMIYETVDGKYGVVDFKTGSTPSWIQIVRGRSPQGPLEILLLANGCFTNGVKPSLTKSGLLSPKGFLEIDYTTESIIASAKGLNEVIETFWDRKEPYHPYIVTNKYPTSCRKWSLQSV